MKMTALIFSEAIFNLPHYNSQYWHNEHKIELVLNKFIQKGFLKFPRRRQSIYSKDIQEKV